MELTANREWPTAKSTCGTFYIDGKPFGYKLELPLGDGKPGSAIPAGRYKVEVYPSLHFGRLMPLVIDPTGERTEIEIHWGSYPDNTRGCTLLGYTHETDFVGESKKAFDDFWAIAQGPIEQGECWITYVDPPSVATYKQVADLSLQGDL